MCRAPALPMPSNVNPATTFSPDNVVPMPAPNEAPPEPDFSAAKNFINRELSWLEFNRRVLEEAQDPTQPLLERVKFLGIVSSNLDEFFEIRVAGIKQQIESETSDVGPDGMSPTETFDAIQRIVHEMVAHAIRALEQRDRAAPARRTISASITSRELNAKRAAWARRYFQQEVFPMLTPLAVDASHPFPQLLNKSHNLLVRARAEKGGEPMHAIVQVPRAVSRLILMPRGEKGDDELGITFTSLPSSNITSPIFSPASSSMACTPFASRGTATSTLTRKKRITSCAASSRNCGVRAAATPCGWKWKRIARTISRESAPRVFPSDRSRSLQARRPAFDDAPRAAGRERRFRQVEGPRLSAGARSGAAAARQHFRSDAQTGHPAASSL